MKQQANFITFATREIIFFQIAPGMILGLFAQMESAGASAIVRDPNRVIWAIAHNPGWPILDDGTVEFA